MTARLPAVAGTFYPGSAETLRGMIAGFRLEKTQKATHGIIVPHAGFMYSGRTAAHVFAPLTGESYDLILLLGPSHHVSFRGVALDENEAWETPLGTAKIDYRMLKPTIIDDPLFRVLGEAHEEEHSLEVQVPFLQHFGIEGPLAPLLIGQVTDENAKKIATALANITEGKNVLIVLSTDLSHYLSKVEGGKHDAKTVDIIGKNDLARWHDIDACGMFPLRILQHLCMRKGWTPQLVHRSDSGDVTGDTKQVVGYASFVF